jgi:hypothetical protein
MCGKGRSWVPSGAAVVRCGSLALLTRSGALASSSKDTGRLRPGKTRETSPPTAPFLTGCRGGCPLRCPRCRPGAFGWPGGHGRGLIVLYFESRELHSPHVVHESSLTLTSSGRPWKRSGAQRLRQMSERSLVARSARMAPTAGAFANPWPQKAAASITSW